jgi:lipopolysaccharide transport system permease protein
LWTLAARDLKVRYRQTALGGIWVVLQPLIAAGIFAFVFGAVAGLRSGPTPYFIFALAGQVAWMAFAATLTRVSTSLLLNTALVSKVYFPRLILPLYTLLSAMVDVAVGLVLLFLLMAMYRLPLASPAFFFPLWLFLLTLMGLGSGLAAAALTVRYRDVHLVLPVLVQLLTYGSPVGWGLAEMGTHIPAPFQAVYFFLNPAAPLVEALRWSLLGQGNPPWRWIGYAAVMALGLLAAGTLIFRYQERAFADVI